MAPAKNKKKGAKKGEKKKSTTTASGSGVNLENILVDELSKEFYLIQIRDLEQKIARYQEKCDKLELLNKEVLKNFDQQSHDKDEIASFLSNKVEKKSIEVYELQEQISSLETKKKKEKEGFELEIVNIKTDMSQMEDKLMAENTILSSKLASLEEFRIQREDLMNRSAEMEEEIKTLQNNHKEQIYQLDRKAVVDKDRLKKEMILRVNTVAAEFRKVSNKQMADTTKRAISENVMINSQLAKMSDKTMELISENDEIKINEKAQSQNIEILEHNEKELMKKNAMHRKLIMMLTEKSQEQENSLNEFSQQEVKFAKLEKEFQTLTMSFESLKTSELSTKKEMDDLQKKIEQVELEKSDMSEDKQYLISILADASYVIKEALQHNGEVDPAITEMKNTNLLNKVVEILNVAAEMGVGINPEELAATRNLRKKKNKKVYLGPLSAKSSSLYDEMCSSRPEPHYNIGDLGFVPSPVKIIDGSQIKTSSQKYRINSLDRLSKKDSLKLPLLTSPS